MTLHDRLEELFQTVLNDDELELRDDMATVDVPGWDSVAHINLMFSIEEAFGVQFAGNTFAEFKDIGELKQFIADQTS